METYIAILRGINVSGQKMIKMEALRKHLEALDFKNITTYIQSGNIIFQCEKSDPNDLTKKIENKILNEYGFEVPTIIRSAEYFKRISKKNPFLKTQNENVDRLYVTFLAEIPDITLKNDVSKITFPGEEFEISNDVIYLFCSVGYGNAKLNNNFFEKKLKVSATTRNWNTVLKLVELSK